MIIIAASINIARLVNADSQLKNIAQSQDHVAIHSILLFMARSLH